MNIKIKRITVKNKVMGPNLSLLQAKIHLHDFIVNNKITKIIGFKLW